MMDCRMHLVGQTIHLNLLNAIATDIVAQKGQFLTNFYAFSRHIKTSLSFRSLH